MVVDNVEYDFHLLPSGVLNKKAVSFIGTLHRLQFNQILDLKIKHTLNLPAVFLSVSTETCSIALLLL